MGFKIRKNQFLLLTIFVATIMVGAVSIVPVQGVPHEVQVVQAAGTAATFADKTTDQAIEDAWVTFFFDGLTTGAEYILVQATLGNITFATGSGQTTKQVTLKVDTSGSLTFDVYGYNVSTGASSGSILDTWLLTVTPSSDFNADQITGAIPLFIGLLIGGLILGIAVKKTY